MGSLFILNLFVGVVINTFNIEKEKLSNNSLLTKLQMEYCDTQLNAYALTPKTQYVSHGNKIVDYSYFMTKNKWFDHFIFACIVANTFCLALTWYGEPEELTNIMEIINYVFTGIYTIEAVIKITAL